MSTRALAWLHHHRALVVDVVVAVLAAGAELITLYDDASTVDVAGIALTGVGGGALVARRRAPVVTLAFTLVIAVALVALGQSPGGVLALVALFTTAEQRERRVSLAALLPTCLLLAIGSVVSVPPIVAVWALGAYAQTRRRYTEALEQRAGQLERERDQLGRIAVHEERVAIARELHDIVAHSVSVMLIGVRGARDVLRASPHIADETLGRVESSGEQSLAELRRILALLREADHDAESRPQPSLGQLDDLVRRYCDAGVSVRLEVVGRPRSLASGVELSVYRIVQEALTNALKHAHPNEVTVTLSFGARRLEVEVVDDGPTLTGDPAPAGHGIVGMRERAALLGGQLQIGPRTDGGYRVAAQLPIAEA